MSAHIIIKPIDQQMYQWLDTEQQQGFVRGDISALREHLSNCSAPQLSLLLGADYCTLKQYHFEPGEQKLLRQTLPYSLEDELLEDVEGLHFGLGEMADQSLPVAVIKQRLLSQWLAEITAPIQSASSTRLDVKMALPELTLLPWSASQWTITVDGSVEQTRFLVRYGAYQGFAFSALLLAQALACLIAEQGLPEQLVIYGSEQQRDVVQAILPSALQPLVQFQLADYNALMIDGFSKATADKPRLNLLQGKFANGLPWRKWWQHWRVPATLLLALVVLQFGLAFINHSQLAQKNMALRQAIEASYRQAIPKGALVDAESQLRRKVAAMQGGGGEGFVSLFAAVSQVTQTMTGIEWQTLNYSEKNNELRLSLIAPSFSVVEAVRAGLEKKGVNAELAGSSSEGDKTRAQLKVRGS